MKQKPEAFDFPEKMEKEYGQTGNIAKKMLSSGVLKGQKSMKFFRGFQTVDDIREMSRGTIEIFEDKHYERLSGGCSESCEPFLGDDDSLDKITITAIG